MPIKSALTGLTYYSWSCDWGVIEDQPPDAAIPTAAANTATTSSNDNNITTPAKKKHKRKFTAINPNDLPDDMCPTLVPKMNTIIARCRPRPSSTSPPDNATGSRKRVSSNNTGVVTANRWSRETDLGNDRSRVPSDRELLREIAREKERARAREEAAAAKRSKRTSKRRGSHNVTTSVSRGGSPESEAVGVASGTKSLALSLASRSMKRTRSAGGAPISAALANTVGTGAVNVSSPLKAVTIPGTPADRNTVKPNGSAESTEPRRGRSRLSGESDKGSPPDNGTTRKANSHSPTTATIPIIIESSPDVLPPQSKPVGRAASAAGHDMRRVVSASNIGNGHGSKADRNGSSLAPESARERSKREVVLPGRLKDYDVKPSTSPTW
jgi:hypothetical protein